jgi:serine-type D-Ala-D-Ala carboxypeptidase/endopeptidase
VSLLAAIALASAPAFAGTFAQTVETRLGEAETPACIAAGIVGETVEIKLGCTPGAGPLAFDEHALFEIGSITKGLTGLLLADMVRKGEVSLDDPVSKYAREGAQLPLRGGKELTLRDLVTHSSGLPRMPPKFMPANPRNPYADFTEDRLYEALAATEIRGSLNHYEYTNDGFMFLTDLIARRLGKPYDVALKERVLDPLGMKETAIVLSPELARRFVPGHHMTYQPVGAWDFPVNVSGVGGVRSSLSDMLKLAAALAGRVDTPLKETIALALEPIRPGGGDSSVGFAWMTIQRADTRVTWHNGGTGGFRSMLAVNPASRTAAVVLVDSEASFDDLGRHLVDPVIPLRKKRVGLAMDLETMKQYTGRYELAPTFAIEVFVEGARLMSQATGQPKFEIVREGPDVYFPYVVQARLRFSRGAAGQVDGLVLEQGGRETKGKRGPSAR